MSQFFRFILVAVFSSLLLIGPLQAGKNGTVGENIRQFVTAGHLNLGNEIEEQRLFQIFTFYEDRDFKPVWTRDSGVKGKGKALLKALQNAREHGLNPAFYDTQEIAERITTTNPEVLGELDILMSLAFSSFATDLSKGRLEPTQVSKGIYIKPFSTGTLTLLDGAEQADNLAPYLLQLISKSPRYDRLKTALAQYRAMAEKGEWPTIAKGKALKEGMDDPRVPALRARLAATGDLATNDTPENSVYDETLVTALKAFQLRHGRKTDGVIGPDTLKVLNVPLSYRIKQMAINLERRRWMKDDFGKRYIFVNLADQFLKVVDTIDGREKTVFAARSVVGKPFFNTPIFNDEMEYLVINPYWNVPASLANREFLPKLRKDPGFLQKQSIRILGPGGEVSPYSIDWKNVSRIPYRLRQDTGKKNALGRIKFMFPNKFSVYIHDTPTKNLFSKDTRFFSAGCVRVQNPTRLAAILLKGQGWTERKILNQISSGKRRIVRFKTKVPVHITYLTSWVNKDGKINFRNDVYSRDDNLIKALLSAGDS